MESEATDLDATMSPNYAYWRQHGGEWADEYDARKRRIPAYHVQELMLRSYFERQAPARVLEFGCGVGRHLRYLCEIPGLDVFGYDQSESMVAQCARWADAVWIAERVRVGAPLGTLPYETDSFDVVYTTEALVHVRPEDLSTVLRELLRICRGHVLHLETAPGYVLRGDAHEGSWYHDLVAAYADLGAACTRLDGGYAAHDPYQVTVGEPAPRSAWSPVELAQLRRLEADLNAGLSELQGRLAGAEARCVELEAALGRASARAARAETLVERERGRVGALLGERERFLTQALEVLRR